MRTSSYVRVFFAGLFQPIASHYYFSTEELTFLNSPCQTHATQLGYCTAHFFRGYSWTLLTELTCLFVFIGGSNRIRTYTFQIHHKSYHSYVVLPYILNVIV
jgi:hypothetical protein